MGRGYGKRTAVVNSSSYCNNSIHKGRGISWPASLCFMLNIENCLEVLWTALSGALYEKHSYQSDSKNGHECRHDHAVGDIEKEKYFFHFYHSFDGLNILTEKIDNIM